MRTRTRLSTLAAVLVAAVVMTLLPATGASAARGGDAVEPDAVCSYEQTYAPSRRDSDEHIRIGIIHQNTNNTSQTITTTLTSSTTGTVSLSVTASVSVSAGVILSGVEASFSVNVSTSLSITTSNSVSVPTPPHSTVFGQYGVFRVRTPGTYYRFATTAGCSSSSGSAYARSPRSIGWKVWEG